MRAVIMFIAGACLFGLGCDSKVQQQRPPEIPEEQPGETDMQAAPEETIAPVEESEEEPTEAELRANCCQVCADAAEADESGDPPGALNCATIAGGDSACVLFFDRTPMTGGEAQACVEEEGAAGAAGGESDVAGEGDAAGG